MIQKLITGFEVALQFFEAVDPTWEMFEAQKDGNLRIGGYIFSMRVGLHLKRPTQAIMGAGQFIKMRSAGNATGRTLKVLDPTMPDRCIYGRGMGLGELINPKDCCWHPDGYLPTKPKLEKRDTTIFDASRFFNNLEKFRGRK